MCVASREHLLRDQIIANWQRLTRRKAVKQLILTKLADYHAKE